uniref:Transmembrane protein 244-like n=1 Tax=Cyprinus carpio TaxID=7962 RepID=A0A8C2AAX8_CYPCA
MVLCWFFIAVIKMINMKAASHSWFEELKAAMIQAVWVFMCCLFAVIRVEEVDSLLAPFDYTTQPSWQSPKYLVSVISTEVTYVLGGLIFAWIVEECVWDYAITVTLLHVALTVAVMADFPSTEHWWIALGSGLLMMIFGGQLLAYRLFRSNFVHPADLQNL